MLICSARLDEANLASIIVSKYSSFLYEGGAYLTGRLIAKHCSFPGKLTWIGVVIRSFTVILKHLA